MLTIRASRLEITPSSFASACSNSDLQSEAQALAAATPTVAAMIHRFIGTYPDTILSEFQSKLRAKMLSILIFRYFIYSYIVFMM